MDNLRLSLLSRSKAVVSSLLAFYSWFICEELRVGRMHNYLRLFLWSVEDLAIVLKPVTPSLNNGRVAFVEYEGVV